MHSIEVPTIQRAWRRAFLCYVALLAALVGAAYLDLVPAALRETPLCDTTCRFVLVGSAALLLELAWGLRRVTVPLTGGRRQLSAAALAVGAVATAEELAQLCFAGRTFELSDLAANLAGVWCFSRLAEVLVEERRRHLSAAAMARALARGAARLCAVLATAALFPAVIFAALAISREAPLPLARYDALLAVFVGVQLLLVRLGFETAAELRTITAFHLLGLAMELFKVHAGSWSYPEPAWTKVGGVPLYSGFMYASVASFLLAVWRRLHVRMEGWPPGPLAGLLGAAVYGNFFTQHAVGDLRWPLMLGIVWLFAPTTLVFHNTGAPRRVPLLAAFAALGVAVWIAENLATYLGAWAYPAQLDGWQMVDTAKIHSWFLLGIISVLLVARGRRHGSAAPQAPAVSG